MKFTDELKQLKPGQSITTDKTKAVCYVTAKRCGLTITVTDNGDSRTITLAGSQVDDVAARMKALATDDRLKVFESFELCCGMNRGQCICEAETQIETLQAPQIVAPMDDKQARLQAARAALMSVGTKVFSPVEEAEPEWQFTKDSPQYDDSGKVYRKQGLMIGGRWKFRTVEVDCDDLDTLK